MTGLFFAASLFRFGMFDLTPIARGVLIEHSPDGMLVLDLQQRIVDLNPAAGRSIGPQPSSSAGHCPKCSITGPPQPPRPIRPNNPIELALPAGRTAEARLSASIDPRGLRQGDADRLARHHRSQTRRSRLAATQRQPGTQALARTAELRAEKTRAIRSCAASAKPWC